MTELRVVDDGLASPHRSQALWHGIAAAMSPEADPVLSFCRPARPYVSLGFHRSIDEIDRAACERRRWPVIRRQIGGGPVYLDRGQLFFQLTLPAGLAPPRVDDLYRTLLAPAVEAFRALGIAAGLRGTNDIAIGDRRLSGTGAGRIGDAVTVVGNVIFDFPHARMVECLALPSAAMRSECLRLMKRHVSSVARESARLVTMAEAKAVLIEAYGAGLGRSPQPTVVRRDEELAVERWERRMRDPDWLGARSGHQRGGRKVKICAGVSVFSASDDDLEVQVSIVDGHFRGVRVSGEELNGDGERLAGALEGGAAEPDRLADRLGCFGAIGHRLMALLEPGLTTE